MAENDVARDFFTATRNPLSPHPTHSKLQPGLSNFLHFERKKLLADTLHLSSGSESENLEIRWAHPTLILMDLPEIGHRILKTTRPNQCDSPSTPKPPLAASRFILQFQLVMELLENFNASHYSQIKRS